MTKKGSSPDARLAIAIFIAWTILMVGAIVWMALAERSGR